MCWNEEAMLPLTVSHYRSSFPNCSVCVLDNQSSDMSATIARDELGCEVLPWYAGEGLQETAMLHLKNTVWKRDASSFDWVVVCDMDELLCMTSQELASFDPSVALVKTKGYDVVLTSPAELGVVRNPLMDKTVCFRPGSLLEGGINFHMGCHTCRPEVSDVRKYTPLEYPILHMTYLGEEYVVKRQLERFERSRNMHPYGIAIHYKETEEEARELFRVKRSQASALPQDVRAFASLVLKNPRVPWSLGIQPR